MIVFLCSDSPENLSFVDLFQHNPSPSLILTQLLDATIDNLSIFVSHCCIVYKKVLNRFFMCDTYFFMIPIFMSILILYHLHKMWVKMLYLCALHFQRTSMNYKHQKKGVFIYQSINLTYMHCIALFHNNKIIYLRVPCFFPDCNKSSCNILFVISTVLLTSLISRIFILFFLYNLAYRYFVCVCLLENTIETKQKI